MHIRRGDVWWVSFDPQIGTEVKKTRPAVVVSNNAANLKLPRVVVVPLTSNVARVYPAEALVTIAGRQAKAMADQITTADKQRLRGKLGQLSSTDMAAVEGALLLHLGLR